MGPLLAAPFYWGTGVRGEVAMTGSALIDFLISLIGLVAIVGMMFFAIEYFALEPIFKRIARLAIGVAALIVFLLAVKGVLFGGGGLGQVTPISIIEFAIGLIVVMLVVWLLYLGVDSLAGWMPEVAGFVAAIKFLISALAIIALLVLAERVLFSGHGIQVSLPHLQESR